MAPVFLAHPVGEYGNAKTQDVVSVTDSRSADTGIHHVTNAMTCRPITVAHVVATSGLPVTREVFAGVPATRFINSHGSTVSQTRREKKAYDRPKLCSVCGTTSI